MKLTKDQKKSLIVVPVIAVCLFIFSGSMGIFGVVSSVFLMSVEAIHFIAEEVRKRKKEEK